MRILHVVASLAQDAGSPAICVGGLGDTLRAARLETALASPEELTGFEDDASKTTSPSATSREGLAQLVEQADVVHIHGWRFPLALAAAKAARGSNTPYVIAPHGALLDTDHHPIGWKEKLRGVLGENKLVRKSATVIALNEFEAGKLKSQRVHGSIAILPYGIDFAKYERTGQATDTNEASSDSTLDKSPKKVCLMLGPLDPIEGFVPLLKAFSELGAKANDWTIALVGHDSGKWRPTLEAAIRRKGGEDRVEFGDASDVETQREWLTKASIVAAPGLHVNCGLSVMQAVASGVPVLASRLVAPDGLREVIAVCESSRAGILTGLRSLIDMTDQQRTEYAECARKSARPQADWSVLVEKYIELYQKVNRG